MSKHLAKKIKTFDITYIQYAVFSMFALAVFSLFGYAYFVNATVHSVVHREDMQEKISSLHSQVSEFESQYFTRIEDIDMELAHKSGFQEISQVHFAQRVTAGREVARADN